MKLTPEQQAALDALPPKRQAFCLALLGEAAGNQTEAARIAGYKAPKAEGCRLLTFADVKGFLEAYRSSQTSSRVATIAELREWWTSVQRGELNGFEPKDRLKATELLGKSQGAFLERREVEHSGTQRVVIAVMPTERPRMRELASESEVELEADDFRRVVRSVENPPEPTRDLKRIMKEDEGDG